MKKSLLPFLMLFLMMVGGCTSANGSPEPRPPEAPVDPGIAAVTPTAALQPAAPPAEATNALEQTPDIAAPAAETPAPTPDIAALVVAKGNPTVSNSYPSPDGQWRIDVVTYPCVDIGKADQYGYEQLKLIDVAGGEERVVVDQLQGCGGIGAFGLGGLFWSPNNQYFYYTDAREGQPDGCGQYWLRPISRLDTVSFETELLGGGMRSPDGKKIATWQRRDLVIWNLDGNEIGRAPAMFENETGMIAWAPDNQSLVYLQYESSCPLGKTEVVRLDWINFKPVLVLESDKPAFGKVSWDAQDELTLIDESGKPWKYSLTKQQFIQ